MGYQCKGPGGARVGSGIWGAAGDGLDASGGVWVGRVGLWYRGRAAGGT